MTLNIQDRHLIDRYLHGDVSGIELESFRERLRSDEGFRNEVDLNELLYEGIQVANHENLKLRIRASLKFHQPRVPLAVKLIVTFLVVTGFGITFWFYAGMDSPNPDQGKSWLAFLRKQQKELEKPVAEENPQTRKTAVAERPPVVVRDSVSESEEIRDTSIANSGTQELFADTSLKEVTEEIIVKQDQLLISANIPVEDKMPASENVKESLAEGAAEKMNPAADLPESETPPGNYLVEFWVSPINYKGYKMSKNKLILFGIEEPDVVKLYRVNDTLYMGYLNHIYRLSNSLDFAAYQKLKESEIPLTLK